MGCKVMGELFDKIEDYVYGDEYPFNMPGHKRNYYDNEFFSELYKRDIMQNEDFGKLYDDEGYIKDLSDKVARTFGADQSFFIADGGSVGVLAALSACVKKGGTLCAGRCSHNSMYKAAYLRELNIEYIYSDIDEDFGVSLGITVEQVEEAIKKNPKIEAVFITSPTREGISSEIEDIAEFLHSKRIPLIVDASWGTHFGFADFLPAGAVDQGADIVIHSAYKTLPAPVGVGMLHVTGSIVNADRIKMFLSLYQSDAQSYMMLAGLDDCIEKLAAKEFAWQDFYNRREKFSKDMECLKHIGTFEAFTKDRWDTPELGKMLIYPKTSRIDGKNIYDRLRKEFHIKAEMYMPAYVLITFSVCDSDMGFEMLANALKKLDQDLEEREIAAKSFSQRDLGNLESLFGVSNGGKYNYSDYLSSPKNEIVMSIYEATESEKEAVVINMLEGRISGVHVGVSNVDQPIVVPGERISREALAFINHYMKRGVPVTGIFVDRMEVLREKKASDKDDAKKASDDKNQNKDDKK